MGFTMTEVASVTRRLNDRFNNEVTVSRTQGGVRDTFNIHIYNARPQDRQTVLEAVEHAVGRKPAADEVTFSKAAAPAHPFN